MKTKSHLVWYSCKFNIHCIAHVLSVWLTVYNSLFSRLVLNIKSLINYRTKLTIFMDADLLVRLFARAIISWVPPTPSMKNLTLYHNFLRDH